MTSNFDCRLPNLIKNLEYCSIERAITLFNIEQDDLYHFLLTGAISCHVLIEEWEVDSERFFLRKKPSIYMGPDSFKKLEELGEETNKKRGSSISHITVTQGSVLEGKFELRVGISGIWRIVGLTSIRSILEIDEDKIPECYLEAETSTKAKEETEFKKDNDYPFIVLNDKLIPAFGIPKDKVILLQSEMNKLYRALIKGDLVLDNIYNSKSVAERETNNTKSTVELDSALKTRKTEIKNAALIEFSLRIFDEFEFDENGSKQITSAATWAEMVSEYCHRVNDWKEKPPLSKDRLTRELSPYFKAKQAQILPPKNVQK
ncbi:hypothetical protein DI392_17470 [Vibrio albus]|uniref:Uncharacterized protein n=1 Tax=Vibrio albus TaxID=2200953 RepID=A0A2U3B5T4_9VIBR|nr:hypothetical protein [Vibrio albus]PWI32150.1 hypothetical protein DI392_17470 [Vibrio albus]